MQEQIKSYLTEVEKFSPSSKDELIVLIAISTFCLSGKARSMVVPSPTAITTSLAQVLSLVRVNTNVTGTPFFTVILFGLKPWLVTSIAMGAGAATTTGAGGAGAGAGFAGAGFVASAVFAGLPASELLSHAFDVRTTESEIATTVEATTSKIGFISKYFLDWL